MRFIVVVFWGRCSRRCGGGVVDSVAAGEVGVDYG